MEHLACPKCGDEFELPLRHISHRHPDEEEYMRLPRLLPCLHTVCQACLERDRDRSKFGKIVCSVCHQDDVIKGVKYLPLDVSSLVEVMSTSLSTSIAHCYRCIEPENSCSWCLTCSEALCELHHRDHELSNQTGTHDVQPFEDLHAKGIKLNPKLPQVICPEEINYVCSCYCFDCMHLLSSESSLSKRHENHSVKKCTDIFIETKNSIDDAVNDCLTCVNKLNEKVQSTRNALTALENNSEKALRLVELEFDKLRSSIAERERLLKEKINAATREKSHQYLNRLSALTATIDDCEHICSVAEGISRDASATPEGNIYLVGAAEHIILRVDDLVTEVKELSSSSVDLIDPRIDVVIDQLHTDVVSAIVSGIGHVEKFLDPLEAPYGSEPEVSSVTYQVIPSIDVGDIKNETDSKTINDSPDHKLRPPMPYGLSPRADNNKSKTDPVSQFFVTSSLLVDSVMKRNKNIVPGFVAQTATTQHVVEIDVRQPSSLRPISSSTLSLINTDKNSKSQLKFENLNENCSGAPDDSKLLQLKSSAVDEAKVDITSSALPKSQSKKVLDNSSGDDQSSSNSNPSTIINTSGTAGSQVGDKVGGGADISQGEASQGSAKLNELDKADVMTDRPMSIASVFDKHGGRLTGKIVVSYELDKRLQSTFELRSYYESWVDPYGCPILKVTKSIVPK